MLRIEAKTATTYEGLLISRSILLQPFTYYKLDSNIGVSFSQFDKTDFTNTKGYLSNSHLL